MTQQKSPLRRSPQPLLSNSGRPGMTLTQQDAHAGGRASQHLWEAGCGVLGLMQEWGDPAGHAASLAAAKCSPSSFPVLHGCAAGGRERSEKLASRIGRAAHLAGLGAWGMLWPSALGPGQSPIHMGGIEAQEQGAGWVLGFACAGRKHQTQGDTGCGKEFILEVGMQGVPDLSDLPKAMQGVCGIACVPPFSPLPFSSLITKDQAGKTEFTQGSCYLEELCFESVTLCANKKE